jgi:hypothetical protein
MLTGRLQYCLSTREPLNHFHEKALPVPNGSLVNRLPGFSPDPLGSLERHRGRRCP